MTRARDIANIIGSGATSSGTITAATLAATTGVTFPDGSIPLVDLDIDGGTDIGAALVDADLMVVDDGAGGTNRKATMSRLATYMGTKVGGGAMEFIASSGAISNAASVAFTQFDSSNYDAYQFFYYYVIPQTDNVYFTWNSSTDGGSSYAESNGDYKYGSGDAGGNVGYGYVYAYTGMGNASGEYGITGASQLMHPHNTTTHKVFHALSGPTIWTPSSIPYTNSFPHGAAYRLSTADIDAIRFRFASGNIVSGEIVMYGIKNA